LIVIKYDPASFFHGSFSVIPCHWFYFFPYANSCHDEVSDLTIRSLWSSRIRSLTSIRERYSKSASRTVLIFRFIICFLFILQVGSWNEVTEETGGFNLLDKDYIFVPVSKGYFFVCIFIYLFIYLFIDWFIDWFIN
jgi:hypothetical protein